MKSRKIRERMTEDFLETVEALGKEYGTIGELMMTFAQSEDVPIELRLKALSKIGDWTLPRASAIDMNVKEETMTPEQIDSKLLALLSEAKAEQENRQRVIEWEVK